ncbi:3'-5' exonuclease [Streptomyces europaeiscabiei]|uniref:3'-5' exonuclease n=1 Tax=Streptomyces europaeiscabiei TaxID=146819 RepID=UPI0038F6C7FC
MSTASQTAHGPSGRAPTAHLFRWRHRHGERWADRHRDTLLNPGGEPIPAAATAIHKITDAMVEGAPTFSEILTRLTEALAGRRIVIYNRDYDTGRLLWELHLHHQAQGTVDFTKHPRYSARRQRPRMPGWTRRRGRSARWSSTPPSTATGTTTLAATAGRSCAAATAPWAIPVPSSGGWRRWPKAVGSGLRRGLVAELAGGAPTTVPEWAGVRPSLPNRPGLALTHGTKRPDPARV